MKACLVAVLLVWSVAASAEDARQLIADIRIVQRSGVALHQTFDLADDTQLAACTEQSRPLRATAKGLRPQALSTQDPELRMHLTLAADAAFRCVYCGDSGPAQCAAIDPDLQRAEAALAALNR